LVNGSPLTREALLQSLPVEFEIPPDELRVMCSDHRGDLLGRHRLILERGHRVRDRPRRNGVRVAIVHDTVALPSTRTVRLGASRLLWRSRIPIDNSHRVITVGPKIVRTRDAVGGSPTSAWTKPAPIEATPATTATQPSHRGYTRLT